MNTRTTMVLDANLIAQAMARGKDTTKKAAVEAALKVRLHTPDYAPLLASRSRGLIDPDYDPKGLYGLAEAALARRVKSDSAELTP